MQRYSKKREAILECLRSTDTHPTAEWIYEKLKPVYPDLSLATVYRNLNEMKAAGLVRSMGVVASHEHFDGSIQPHRHAVCNVCGKILDVAAEGADIPEEITRQVEEVTGFKISYTAVSFNGICEECRKKQP